MTINIETLKKIGSEWQKDQYHRIYFNDLPSLFGLKIERYNSGSIMNAWLDGRDISNGAARGIIERLTGSAKLWFDVKTGEFQYRGMKSGDAEKIIENIQAKASELEAA
jgi:hypothetical protein